MNEQTFVDRREQDWQRLSHLCDRAEISPARLAPAELREMVRLYRRISTDLSVARTRSKNHQLVEFLNDLAVRTYGVLYRTPRSSFLHSVEQGLLAAVGALRRARWFVLVSFIIFFGAALLSFFLIETVPETRDYFVPAQLEENFVAWRSGRHEPRDASDSVAMTGFYASNNPTVSILTGAVGAATFGVMSAVLLFTNGALLGALAHDVAPEGHLFFLLSSIAPHGVPEISGIMISGAAGLMLGWALINPGQRRRGDALKAVGKDAVTLLVVSILLMLIAAPIEGFFSFNPAVPQELKAVVAGVLLVAWIAFWASYGREPKSERAAPPDRPVP
jgi:uncharacterized membrane protein SpoIIM required for sporulation